MSIPNAAAANLLKLVLNNVTMALVGDATGLVGSTTPGSLYVSLHTADPGETGDQTTSEATYTGYARVAITRSTGSPAWTVTTADPASAVNAAAITFPACTAGSSTCTYFALGTASTGAGSRLFDGPLTALLAVSAGITPEFAASSCQITLD